MSDSTATPYEVDECRGVLRVYSDGSIWRSTEPSFKVPVNDDGSVLWKDVLFDPTHNLHLRLYKPSHSNNSFKKLPIFYYIHGGGFCIGSRTWPNCQNYCFKLALDLEAVVISPDYRLAPENRLPAAIEDGFTAVKWLQAQAVSEKGDTWLTEVADFSKVFISGDSAGGNIAHNLAVRLGAGSPELSPVRVRGYVLLAPFFGGTVRSVSEAEGPKDAFLNLELIDRFFAFFYFYFYRLQHEYQLAGIKFEESLKFWLKNFNLFPFRHFNLKIINNGKFFYRFHIELNLRGNRSVNEPSPN